MKSYAKKIWPVLLILVISLLAARELFLPGYFPMHDDLQISRLYQMDKCIRDLQIPCRWVPDMGYGYGYPLFNYYAPFPYYLGEVFHLLGLSFIAQHQAMLINSVKLLFILGFIFSGIFMFLLGRELWGKLGGLVSAVFYIFAPYYAVDIYVRGAMGEFWGLVFFPAIFWAVFLVIKRGGKNNILLFAFFYGLLLLSHNIMSMIFTPLIFLWSVFLIWFLKAKWRVSLLKLVLGGAWGLGLAAFFILPALLEKNFVHTETMLMGYFNYLAHFISLKQLFFSRFWGFGASTWGEDDGMPFQIGYLHWIIPTLSLILFSVLLLRKRISGRPYLLFAIYYLLFLGSAFLTHLRSTPVWQTVKLLEYLQFPWRFLALTIFAASVLSGSVIFAVDQILKKRTDLLRKPILELLTLGLIGAVIVLNFNYFKPEKILKITDEEKLFSPKGWNKLQTDAIFDYLPIFAKQPPANPAPEGPEVFEGKAGLTYLERGTNWYQFNAEVLGEKAKIRLPIYDFPGWKVLVDKKEAKISHDNLLGLITFEIPSGNHIISARLTNTPIRTFSNLVSLFAWLALVLTIIKLKSANESN